MTLDPKISMLSGFLLSAVAIWPLRELATYDTNAVQRSLSLKCEGFFLRYIRENKREQRCNLVKYFDARTVRDGS